MTARETEALTHRRVLIVFSGLMLATLLGALDSTIVATALPTIVSELGGLERLPWVVTAYLLAQTVATPLYGKLGDLYGRKVVLQSAVVIFLLGSALCGLSGSMLQLILFRFLQGIGGGGLVVTTMAVVGEIVPPRDRGRYQGIFGAVFGLASVAGPLLGGYFTTHWTWRWIFYINLPLGALALFVIAATLPAHSERRSHRIDWAGATLLALGLTGIILITDLGGTHLAWASPQIITLAVLAALSLLFFLFVERRAAEPVMPLHLFRNRSVSVTVVLALITGFALFGSVTYLPLFLQVVKGSSPTESGLQMLPQMAGVLVTSILSGQLISRTGRYRIFPIMGMATLAVALFLLSRTTQSTSMNTLMVLMAMLGCGVGMIMQVLVIAVQNAVDIRDLGVATSGNTLSRLVGGSVGTAALGAVFTGRLTSVLAQRFPAGKQIPTLNIHAIEELPAQLRTMYVQAFAEAFDTVFLVACCIAVIGFALSWLLPEHPLRGAVAETSADLGQEMGGAMAMPETPEAVVKRPA